MTAIDMLGAHVERCPTCKAAEDPEKLCAEGHLRWMDVVSEEKPTFILPDRFAHLATKPISLPELFKPFAPMRDAYFGFLNEQAGRWENWSSTAPGDPVADMQAAFDKAFKK